VTKLHKLYLLAEMHGRGLGSRLLQHVEQEIQAGQVPADSFREQTQHPAIAVYRRNGFVIAESVITDIGGGFVMDDYVMAKELAG